jgi:hypothetical protein
MATIKMNASMAGISLSDSGALLLAISKETGTIITIAISEYLLSFFLSKRFCMAIPKMMKNIARYGFIGLT